MRSDRIDRQIQGAPVRVVDLVKRFGQVRAVDGVSFTVRVGEFLALVGPSGSGKTTILMTIAGFERPTSGDVHIGDARVTDVPPYRRGIGMVFQKYALFPHMSVWDNIAYPLRMRRVPTSEIGTRVEAALDLIQLSGLGARLPHQLSGGQQQRVALARAIVYRPPVLLMDEPLGALDRKLRQQMQLEIKHLQKQLGATVIYVTHDQEEALTMADRIGVLSDGRLEQLGTPEELYERPASSFVADFIGEMNFLEGTLRSVEGDRCAIGIEPGLTIEARVPAGAMVRPGLAVRAAIRPERVAARQVSAGRDWHDGRVEETVYAGSSILCIVRLGERTTLMVRVASGADAHRWKPGDRMEVRWHVDDAQVYVRDA